MSEVIVNEDSKAVQPQSVDDLAKILQSEFASSAMKVYVNSIDQEVTFREITVNEQKSLTRIMSTNERRKDIVYDAQCAMINTACKTEGFDIRRCSEFDRLKLMIALYQANMSSNIAKFTCEECGTENSYKIDFDKALQKLDAFDLTPKSFHYENKNYSYDFVLQYPTVSLVHKFYESYCRTHQKPVPKKEVQADETMQNIEYVDLFITSIKLQNKQTNQNTDVVFANYPVSAYEKILSTFPQDVMYSDDGVLKFIVKELIQPLNDAFDKHICYNCGTVHEKENANQAESFF